MVPKQEFGFAPATLRAFTKEIDVILTPVPSAIGFMKEAMLELVQSTGADVGLHPLIGIPAIRFWAWVGLFKAVAMLPARLILAPFAEFLAINLEFCVAAPMITATITATNPSATAASMLTKAAMLLLMCFFFMLFVFY